MGTEFSKCGFDVCDVVYFAPVYISFNYILLKCFYLLRERTASCSVFSPTMFPQKFYQ